jgi:peptidoglycan/xylan/chitin deacetylase (PgdA/CDA1 family)
MFMPFVGVTANADATNLIANASTETANGSAPQDWLKDSWGTNTPTYTYNNTGHTGTHSVTISMNSYTSGDAKWYFSPVAVQGSTKYDFSDYYQSTIANDVVAQFDDGAGNYTYLDLGSASASSAWKQYTASFTTPSNTKNVTIFHLIAAVGSLTTDDFSLTANTTTTTPPTTGNLITNPSVETANANNSANPDSWATDSWGTNTPTYSYLSTGHTDSRSVQVSMTKYTSGDAKWDFAPVAVQSGTNYSFSDYYESTVATDVVAQFDDGAGNYTYLDLGAAATSATWKQYAATITVPTGAKNVTIFHLIAAVGSLTTDDFSLTAGVTATPTVPLVSVTTPTSGATVNATTTTLTASATAQGGNTIKKVQFMVDGVAVGTADTTAPYSYAWDASSVASGSHTITAIVTATDAQTATSTPVTITVNNPNIIPNASLETTDTSTGTTLPLGWYQGAWGTNTTTFAYSTTAHTGKRSVKITTTKFTDGGANWSYGSQPVQAGKLYSFSDYYQSTAASQVLVSVQMSNGTTQYIWLGNPYTSNGTWTKFFSTFTMPAGAVSATAYQSIAGVGYIMTDDYSLQTYTPTGFTQPLVSVTFDDGIASQYTNGLPIMQKYGLKGTYYIISGYLGVCDPSVSSLCYMTSDNVKSLYSAGQEIGSHTITHPDLTTITSTQLTQELGGSQTALQQILGGIPVTDFAAPYGNVNLSVLTASKKYYASQRGTQAGYNSIDNYNSQDLLVQDVDTDTTVAQVQSYIDYAKATNTWLILVYHDINPDVTVDPGYDTTPADFDTEMAYLKASGVKVDTLAQGLTDVASQVK